MKSKMVTCINISPGKSSYVAHGPAAQKSLQSIGAFMAENCAPLSEKIKSNKFSCTVNGREFKLIAPDSKNEAPKPWIVWNIRDVSNVISITCSEKASPVFSHAMHGRFDKRKPDTLLTNKSILLGSLIPYIRAVREKNTKILLENTNNLRAAINLP